MSCSRTPLSGDDCLTDVDRQYLRRALELAEHGRGRVEPNPLVGAVVVHDGTIAGEGWHERFGGPHAEVIALERAGDAVRGADLYVTLEPCCHHGKTPACTERIIHAGVHRVVAAMEDPFPDVRGGGFAALRDAGISVSPCPDGQSTLYRDAARLNAPYLKLLGTGMPYVQAKWAMTLDGRIAAATGHSQWISGEQSRQLVHQLRGEVDAIVIGSGTAAVDNPLLTARPPGPRVAVRVVLDRQGRLGSHTQLVHTAKAVPVLVAVTPAASQHDVHRLEAAGCECLVLDCSGETGESVAQRCEERSPVTLLLEELGRRRMTNVLVEGGAGVLGSFFEAGQIDVVHVFLAPKLLGGVAAKSPLGGRGLAAVPASPEFEVRQVTRFGDDVYVRAERRVTIDGTHTLRVERNSFHSPQRPAQM